MGALTLLLPYFQSPQEAKDAVSYVTYGPNGLRGMAGMTRATRYGMVENYFERASEQICLLVQVETMEAIEQLDAIALTPGIDGVFIGPADLSASMGYPGEINHPEVVKVILDAISKLNSLNVPSGILTLDFDSAKRYINAGTSFTAVGVDMVLLAESTRNLRKQFKQLCHNPLRKTYNDQAFKNYVVTLNDQAISKNERDISLCHEQNLDLKLYY